MGRERCRPPFCVCMFLSLGIAFCGKHWSGLPPTRRHAERTQPPQTEAQPFKDPPIETGRNPQAVALDFIWGIVSLPVLLVGLFFAILFGGFLGEASKPPPSVALNEALTSLTSIEDDYDRLGPSMGLRQRLAKWFQSCEPKRRLDFELQDIEDNKLREKIRKRGMDAAEDIAAAVEYFIAGNGIMDDSGSSRFADRIASEEASRGYPEAEKFAEQALHEGRKALAETVSMLEEALEEN